MLIEAGGGGVGVECFQGFGVAELVACGGEVAEEACGEDADGNEFVVDGVELVGFGFALLFSELFDGFLGDVGVHEGLGGIDDLGEGEGEVSFGDEFGLEGVGQVLLKGKKEADEGFLVFLLSGPPIKIVAERVEDFISAVGIGFEILFDV